MIAHLFGASSSLNCSHFPPKQTAVDNSKTYGTSAAKFLFDDFYVDERLKRCEAEKEAIVLANVTNLFAIAWKCCAPYPKKAKLLNLIITIYHHHAAVAIPVHC